MLKINFNLEDLNQIVIGAFTLAVPISFSEEAWKLGEELPMMNIGLIFFISMFFLSIFAFQSVFQGNILNRKINFVLRVVIAYVLTAIVVAVVLLSLNKFPLLTEPLLSLKRLVLVGMPASMGAIIVDGFDKE